MKLKAPRFLPSTPMVRDLRLFLGFKARLDGIETTTCVVVNTFEELLLEHMKHPSIRNSELKLIRSLEVLWGSC